MKKQWINTAIWFGISIATIGAILLFLYVLIFHYVVAVIFMTVVALVLLSYVTAKDSPIYKGDKKLKGE